MSENERKEPYEVCIKGEDRVIGYACPKCHLFCSPLIYACKWEDALKAAYDHALTCCADRVCQDCGVNMGSPKSTGWLACASCRQERSDKQDAERFEKATKITLSEYEGSFLYYCDEFYDDYESLWDDRDEQPKYAWACYPIELTIDAENMVSNELEYDHHEDAYEGIGDANLKRLQKYLDLWCKKVAVRSYMPDFKLAVLLPQDEQTDEHGENDDDE